MDDARMNPAVPATLTDIAPAVLSEAKKAFFGDHTAPRSLSDDMLELGASFAIPAAGATRMARMGRTSFQTPKQLAALRAQASAVTTSAGTWLPEASRAAKSWGRGALNVAGWVTWKPLVAGWKGLGHFGKWVKTHPGPFTQIALSALTAGAAAGGVTAYFAHRNARDAKLREDAASDANKAISQSLAHAVVVGEGDRDMFAMSNEAGAAAYGSRLADVRAKVKDMFRSAGNSSASELDRYVTMYDVFKQNLDRQAGEGSVQPRNYEDWLKDRGQAVDAASLRDEMFKEAVR